MMKISIENLSDIKEEYEEAHRLMKQESKNDPPMEPFRSHYTARDVLHGALRTLKILAETLDPLSNDACTVRCVQANIIKDIAKITTFVEEPNGATLLKEALELIQKDRAKEQAINVHIEILNHLGIMECNHSNYAESKQFFDEAKDLYSEAKEMQLEPLTMAALCGIKDDVEKGKGGAQLEENHTLTLYYLAQVFSFLDDLAESARHNHMALKRRLQYNQHEYIDWAFQAASLLHYYIPENYFKQARHLLAAATFMLNKYEVEIVKKIINPRDRAEKEKILRIRMADIGISWAKYGMHILESSKARLRANDNNDEDAAVGNWVIPGYKKPPLSPVKTIDRFAGLDLVVYENQVTDELCLTFDDAKLVMLNSLSWLNKAKEYYTQETDAYQYAKIMQDIAYLYSMLVFFEKDKGNRCKLFKRSADQLEEIMETFNPTYYQTICRQTCYQLGLLYSNMLNVKLTQLEEMQANDRPTLRALNKINLLCEKSIRNLKKFIESYKIPLDTLILPDKIERDEMKHILYTFCQIARLYNNFITPDKRLKLRNSEESFLFHSRFVACTQDERMQPLFTQEQSLSQLMIILLPLDIEKLKRELIEG